MVYRAARKRANFAQQAKIAWQDDRHRRRHDRRHVPPSWLRRRDYAATTAGIGSAVTDLIFSIAKREVTFFSGTALISFL